MVTSKSAEVGDRILKVTFCFILMEEIWKDVVGYEGLYQVSNLGRVKSIAHKVRCRGGFRTLPTKLMSPQTDKKKNFYYFVRLHKNGVAKSYFVHRLVAVAFIDNPNNLPQINHKDGNKRNNNVNNIEWCTASENSHHAFTTGLSTPTISHYRGVQAFRFSDNSFVGEYKSQHEAAKILGLNVAHICSNLHGRCEHIKGYYFKYNGIEKKQKRIYKHDT